MSIFVASPVDVYRDGEADDRLRSVNDIRFASEFGILSVDDARWQAAQKYERDTWLVYNPGATSDRNEQHRDGFGGYAALGDDLGNVIELGCGPFTNLRHIIPTRTALSVTLLDPLIKDYMTTHPNCTYRNSDLNDYPVVPVAKTIEELKTKRKFDTVVMVNVLAHCYNARKVFDKIYSILAPDGVLVFNELPCTTTPEAFYDVGHPLQVSEVVIDAFLSEFEPMYRNGAYFIGRWKGAK